MFWEVFLATLGSIGGATVVVGGLSLFLSRVWAERIKRAAIAKFDQELEILRSANTKALEAFRAEAAAYLGERKAFTQFSAAFYQKFFEKRVSVYEELLRLINAYRKKMREDFLTDELEIWHEQYVESYRAFRDYLTKDQLYISNQAEAAFEELRSAISPYLASADREEAIRSSLDEDIDSLHNARREHEDRALRDTSGLMEKLILQIQSDVSKMRARIEMDVAPRI
ncbi:MAG TPA: hypothetical protein VGU65_10935 [Frateuria sp.]|uniref:hypothetical protein n=1 Tax=Frateuria sp. TaxID=2211372 RepID=UPI002DEA02D3|nr:hypothetical protein [Frateuria sp.]